jgi:predicted PurR-regulated permease PerM
MKFQSLQTGLFISLVVIATGLFLWLVHNFLHPIFWAIVLAILFYPAYNRILVYIKGRQTLAVLLTIMLVLLIVLVPLYFVGSLVVEETIALYRTLSSEDATIGGGLLTQLQNSLGFVDAFGLDAENIEERIVTFVKDAGTQIGTYALDIGRATAGLVLATFLTLYLLFFALRDGEHVATRVMHALPLGDKKERMLVARFVSIVRAMFKGTFVVALVQGVIGGLLFAAVGLQSAVLWAAVMAIFALIPAVGPAIVWVPVGVFLLLTGSVWQGVLVLAVGALIISLIDNVLRPMLVGRDTAMPDALVLLSVLGGISLFGIAGLIIGPVISAFFLSMWQLFEHDYEKELDERG